MKLNHNMAINKITLLFVLVSAYAFAQNSSSGKLNGKVDLDPSWSSHIYLSFIPTFNDIHSMSNEMIIADSKIDSLGYFEFELDFLPREQTLYRLHISKKGDSKTSLIMGGLNENFLVFVADRNSEIKLNATSSAPPFRDVTFETQDDNFEFQKVTSLFFKQDSIASQSGRSKRNFIKERLNEELLTIADSSSNSLVSLYAIYKSDFQSKS